MKRFLIIAAAAISIVACSQTGVVEPAKSSAVKVGAGGKGAKIARVVSAPPGMRWVSNTGQSIHHGRVISVTNIPGGFRIECSDEQLAQCWSISNDGTNLNINDGLVTNGPGDSGSFSEITLVNQ